MTAYRSGSEAMTGACRPRTATLVCAAIVAVAIQLLGAAAAAGDGAERFGPLAALIGCWQGTSTKPDGSAPGLVEQTYEYVLGGKFIRAESVAMFPPEVAGTHYEIHRDVGFISLAGDEERYIWRGFFSEGFVTREAIAIEEDGRVIVIESVEIENGPAGMRTRQTLTLESATEMVDRFEIAMPGMDFRIYNTITLRRAEEF